MPSVTLPKYSRADDEDFESFISNFETIVDKFNLGSYEKYVLLSEQLSGDPLDLVKSLRGAKQSYPEAKKLLKKAFASEIKTKGGSYYSIVEVELIK